MNPKTRIAIYTRKSTDEGLDQEFNSLDAQRGEAHRRGERLSGEQALARAGLEKIRLHPKDGLALINGTQVMCALVAHGRNPGK